MNLSIAIITPSLNQGCFIERTIQSVLQQNIPNLSYFILDGGSTDETLSILKKYENQLTWFSEKDKGQSEAINKGFSKSKSDIVGWLNSDDIYYPETLNKVLKFFKENPAVDVVYGDAFHIDENDQMLSRYPTENWNLKRLKKTCYISQPAVFFRRKVLAKYGMLDEKLKYCMDYEYWLRLGLAGVKFSRLKEVLSGSRLYPQTKTIRDASQCYEEAMSMLKAHLGYVPAFWLLNYAIFHMHKISNQPFSKFRFILKTILSTGYFSFYWNGILRGGFMNLWMPFIVLEFLMYKKMLKQ